MTKPTEAPEAPAATEAPEAPTALEPPAEAPASAAPAPRRTTAVLVTLAGGTAVTALGTLLGLWFLPFLVGLAAGLTSRFVRTPRGYLTAPAAAALGWAIPLGVQALGGAPVGEVARTTAALAGLPAFATAIVAVALLIPLLQALVGVWFGRTVGPRGRTA
ncbi:hypothetical protein [Streptomyces sp. CBMA123]|uniref:hypothetical protein n=1 Tax=Streptomyces sp. CBMA123 TaxID=1896313 RepID=UPI001661AEEA|nr:hypothetical protein [Streptomyces sp. CBMA123]MBD0693640.1 hypothetical protein [Streptomyces sp. CBMA123]